MECFDNRSKLHHNISKLHMRPANASEGAQSAEFILKHLDARYHDLFYCNQ